MKWAYDWTCSICGTTKRRLAGLPPERTYVAGPSATISPYPPVTPPKAQAATFRPWGRCRLDPGLIRTIVSLADQYADTTDEEAILGRPSLLDHEGHRVTTWGGFLGDPADPTGVRHALAYLRHATRPGSPNVTDLVETATLSTTMILGLLPQRAAFAADIGLALEIPELFDVGPVIGSGQDSFFARYERRVRRPPVPQEASPEVQRLLQRIDLGDQIVTDIDFMLTADHDFEWKSDLRTVVKSAQRWSGVLSTPLDAGG